MKHAIAALIVLTPALALAEGDAEKGRAVFAKCTACHAIDAPQNKMGPHLVGIVGRKVAAVTDYATYSEALKAKGAGGAVWDEASLSAWLAGPRKFIPGNRMSFTGLKKPEDVADIIAYLKSKQPQ